MVGTEVGETMSTIKRYIRLTYLSNYLLEFVDKNELPFTVAVDISYLKSNEQSLLLAFIGTTKKMPNGSQAKKLKELSQQKELTGEDIEKILRGEAKVNYQKISFSEKQLQKYFPPDYKKEQIEKIIFQLLDSWKAQTEQRDDRMEYDKQIRYNDSQMERYQAYISKVQKINRLDKRTKEMTIGDVIKKSILPLIFMVFWFWMTKTIMKVSGQTDWFWWIFIDGLPFGIHKMRLILIPRGMDTTATLGMAALSVIIGALIGSIMIPVYVIRAIYVFIRYIIER